MRCDTIAYTLRSLPKLSFGPAISNRKVRVAPIPTTEMSRPVIPILSAECRTNGLGRCRSGGKYGSKITICTVFAGFDATIRRHPIREPKCRDFRHLGFRSFSLIFPKFFDSARSPSLLLLLRLSPVFDSVTRFGRKIGREGWRQPRAKCRMNYHRDPTEQLRTLSCSASS